MRRAICLSALAVVLLTFPTGSGAGSKPQVICWKFDRAGMHKRYQTAPRNCFIFKDGATFNAEGSAGTKHVHWKWGNGRAKGKGKLFISTVGPVPARFRLTKPVERCGHTVFSKINVQYRIPPTPQYPGDKGHYSFHVYTC